MKAFLALEDGTVYEGKSAGASGEAIGTVVFTTVMSGFQEALTDPAYAGEILAFTDPVAANYGVNGEDDESDRVQCRGVIMKDPSETPSNFRATGTMPDYLAARGVVCIRDIDTRSLTRHLRDHGAMRGMISTDPDFDFEAKLPAILAHRDEASATAVGTQTVERYPVEHAHGKIAIVDLGVRKSVIDAITARGYSVVRFPAAVSIDEIKAEKPNGILISNGPGNPHDYPELVELCKAIAKAKLPTLAVGLGNTLFALAKGLKVTRMPFGHHGNHPVKDLATDRVFAAMPNQNYTIVPDSVKSGVATVTHVDMHDGTVEGVRYEKAPVMGLQFYPDPTDAIHNASYLFRTFASMLKK